MLGPSLTEIGPGTVLVALGGWHGGDAGVRDGRSAAVGVAISVTTIPAAAYLGCSVGLGTSDGGGGALEVLATNVVCIVAGSTLTLLVQRHWRRAASSPPSRLISSLLRLGERLLVGLLDVAAVGLGDDRLPWRSAAAP